MVISSVLPVDLTLHCNFPVCEGHTCHNMFMTIGMKGRKNKQQLR